MAIARTAAALMIAACAVAAPKETKVATSTKPLQLGSGAVTVTLHPKSVDASRRLFLVLRGLSAQHPPGVLYHVYVALPAGAQPAADDPRHVGILNFYDTPPLLSFDVTAALRDARAKDVRVTFLPAGTPDPGANAAIARVELVEQ